MENLDKLQTRVKDILEQYKKLESAHLGIEDRRTLNFVSGLSGSGIGVEVAVSGQ